MGLLSSIVGAATAGMDMFVGGQLTKAKLKVEDDEAKDLKDLELEFQFNPEEIKITRQQATMKQKSPATLRSTPSSSSKSCSSFEEL